MPAFRQQHIPGDSTVRTLSLLLLPLLLAACVEARMKEQGRRPFSRHSTFPEDATVAVERVGKFILSIPALMIIDFITDPFGWDDDEDEDDCDDPSGGFPAAGSAAGSSAAAPRAPRPSPPPASNRHVGRRRSR